MWKEWSTCGKVPAPYIVSSSRIRSPLATAAPLLSLSQYLIREGVKKKTGKKRLGHPPPPPQRNKDKVCLTKEKRAQYKTYSSSIEALLKLYLQILTTLSWIALLCSSCVPHCARLASIHTLQGVKSWKPQSQVSMLRFCSLSQKRYHRNIFTMVLNSEREKMMITKSGGHLNCRVYKSTPN